MRSFLGCCRSDWAAKDLSAVQRKLAVVGVDDIPELLKRIRDGSLNDSLEKAGERRFTADTLESMRCVGVQMTSPSWFRGSEGLLEETSSSEEKEHGPSKANAYDFDFLDPTGLFGDFLEDGRQPRCDSQPSKRSLGRWMRSRKFEPHDEEASLRHEICRGLSQMAAVSAEARRRNFEVTRCLEEVQADISRITEKMSVARQRQAAKYHDLMQDQPIGNSSVYSRTPLGKARRPSSLPSDAPLPPTWPRRPGSESRRKQPSELRGGGNSRRPSGVGGNGSSAGSTTRSPKEAFGTRGMQSGFTFGGNAPQRSPRAPPLKEARKASSDATNAVDSTARAREAVRQQLLSVLDRSDMDKRAFVKRLLVKWHPDRNPESIEAATNVFQYIQQEKQHLLGL